MALPENIDRALLHVFVFGPGYGEGIAVALPGHGWIVVDGCRTPGRDEVPLIDLLDGLRGPDEVDLIEAVILTHPHEDHYHGIAALLEAHPPDRVGCVAGGSIQRLAEAQASAYAAAIAAADPERARVGELVTLMNAIQQLWRERPESRLELLDSTVVPVTSPGVTLTARAPDAQGLNNLTALPPSQLAPRVNELSVVLELEWRATRIVLGGDLPTRTKRCGSPIPTGWDAVTARRPELGVHQTLKCPHHASAEAFHTSLHTARGAGDRAWVVTPWNKRGGLPQTGPDQGLRLLLTREPEILLTAAPLGLEKQRGITGGSVTVAQLDRQVVEARAGSWELVDMTPAGDGSWADRAWAVAIDAAGTVVERWSGARALQVLP